MRHSKRDMTLDEALSVYYSPIGRHGKSIRLMVGIHILKHRYNCSDDRAVEMLHENAYWRGTPDNAPTISPLIGVLINPSQSRRTAGGSGEQNG